MAGESAKPNEADANETNKLQEKETSSGEEEMEDDDSSGDSSGAEEDSKQVEIMELESQLKDSPFHYDSHVALIKLLKKEGELEKLRAAREHMRSIFPLTQELWLDWIQDELKFTSDSKKERDVLNSLFDKAVEDYLSIPLWLEYVQFAIGGMGEPDGLQGVRHVFERAVTACGLHVSQGATIWEAYREFENAVLMGLQPAPGSVSTKEQQDQLTAQMNKVKTLFRRQLSVPLVDMKNTYMEYLEWCSGEVDSNIKAVYDKAKTKMAKLEPYENALINAKAPRLSEYESYLEYEQSQKEPVRIQCLFERALQENCLNAALWMKYTKYLDEELKIGHVILAVYARAVRNCPWSVQLWLGYVRAMERHSQPHNDTRSCFEQALTTGVSQASDFLELWLAYCDYLRRKICWEEEHSQDLEELRMTFDRAIEHIYTYFPDDGDPRCSLLQYWARIEAVHCKNMEKTRDLWSQIMQAGHAHEAQMWLDNFNMERAYGDIKHCRKVLQKAISSTSDWPESVFEAYINFERESGTLQQFDTAVLKVEAQMARVKERREKAAEKEAALVEQKKLHRKEKQASKKADKSQQKRSQQAPGKACGTLSDENALDKQVKSEFKVPPSPASTMISSQQKPKSAPPPGFKRKTLPPPGYKPQTDAEDILEPPMKKSRGDNSEPSGQPKEVDRTKASCTAFVSNLAYNVSEDRLQEIFSKTGEITEIRLIKNFKGKSKGYAYVEFKDELAAKEALKMDRQVVDGRPMFVSECHEGGGGNKEFKFDTGLEKKKLFIRGLPFTCTEEALENIFKQHGALKVVRLVTYRNGTSKGLAYVEYENEADTARAVLKTDGLQIGDHTISVAISNPPPRKAPAGQQETAFTPALGGGKKDFGVRGKAHTQISLVPRNVKPGQSAGSKPKPSTVKQFQSESGSSKGTNKEETKMSNDDFRKLLLNN